MSPEAPIHALVPRELRERKAPHGKPCTSCGLCCMTSLCQLAQGVLDKPRLPGPCPALMLDAEGKSSCGMVVDPGRFAPARVAEFSEKELGRAAAFFIGAGDGCDMSMEGDNDPTFTARREAESHRQAGLTLVAMRMWGLPWR